MLSKEDLWLHMIALDLTFLTFSRVTDEELKQVEMILNQSIRDNTPLTVHEDIDIDQAKEMGAMALFGENMEIG